MRGLTYTTGLLLVLLIGLSVVFVIGANLLFNTHKFTEHTLSVKVLSLYKDANGYDLKILLHNDGTDPVTIEKITIYDGEHNLTYGDNGSEDGLNGYNDTFKKITIKPGSTYILEVYHYVPTAFKLKDKVLVLVYYTVSSRQDVLLEARTGEAYISVKYGNGEDNNPPIPPPPTTTTTTPQPRNLKVTLKYKLANTMHVRWVEIPITSSIAPEFFNSDQLSVKVKSETGKTLTAKVVYYNKKLGYAVIAVDVSKVFRQREKYTLIITKSSSSNPSQTWHWEPLWFTRMNQYTKTLYTEITYEKILNNLIEVRTGPWYRDRPVKVTYVKQDFPIIKAFLIILYEYRLSTTYSIYITMANGKIYKVDLTSCWYKGPELRVWDGNNLIYQKELGCRRGGSSLRIFFTSDTSISPLGGSPDAMVQLPAPITNLEILPVGGDSGSSYFYSYIYVPYISYPAGAYTFYLFDISYSR